MPLVSVMQVYNILIYTQLIENSQAIKKQYAEGKTHIYDISSQASLSLASIALAKPTVISCVQTAKLTHIHILATECIANGDFAAQSDIVSSSNKRTVCILTIFTILYDTFTIYSFLNQHTLPLQLAPFQIVNHFNVGR